MALTIGELVAFIRADNRGFRRGMRDSRRDFERFERDANGRLHDMNGRFVAEGRRSGRGWGLNFTGAVRTALKAGFKAAGMVKPLLAPIVAINAIAQAAVSAAPLLAPVGAELAAIGHAALAAAPALLSFAAAGVFVKATLGQIFKEGGAA